MVVEPFGLSSHSFERKTQTFGYCTAAAILRSATNDNAMQIKDPESMIYHHPARRSRYAFALVRGVQPIAHGGGTVGPINSMMANHAAEMLLKENDNLESSVFGKLPGT